MESRACTKCDTQRKDEFLLFFVSDFEFEGFSDDLCRSMVAMHDVSLTTGSGPSNPLKNLHPVGRGPKVKQATEFSGLLLLVRETKSGYHPWG